MRRAFQGRVWVEAGGRQADEEAMVEAQ